MILHRVEQEQWLSNAYLIADRPGGTGLIIDGNGLEQKLEERAERESITIKGILLTHWHHDHVAGIEELSRRHGLPVAAHRLTAEKVDLQVDDILEPGDRREVGELEVEAIDTPGHADGHLAFLVNGTDCFTGDVIFKGTVGGTMAPGAPGFEAQRESIMKRLMTLPPETRLHPGHREPTTVADEWEKNPFVRVWRGLDPEGQESCTVFGDRAATLILWAPDYDGTNKAWVRFEDGSEGIVGGSQVTR